MKIPTKEVFAYSENFKEIAFVKFCKLKSLIF